MSTLFLLVFLNTTREHWSPRYGHLISGRPTVLVYDGKFVLENMRHERVPPDEVFAETRKAGLAALSDVRWALIEPDRMLSFIPVRQDTKEITPSHRRRE